MRILSVQRIWNRAPHSAFTDLARFGDRWYCAFREGRAHAGQAGKVRVIASDDARIWESVHLAAVRGTDLRDPKLSVTGDDRLMLLMGGTRISNGEPVGRRPLAAFSTDGRIWSAPEPILSEGDWLWRADWRDGRAFGVSYRLKSKRTWELDLFETGDGLNYRKVCVIPVRGKPNETTVRRDADGRMTALIRREGGDKMGLIGTSREPYTDWAFRSAGKRLGGPNFIILPDGSMAAGTRIIRKNGKGGLVARMGLGFLESGAPEAPGRGGRGRGEGRRGEGGRGEGSRVGGDGGRGGGLSINLELPSDGDCSYPGLVWFQDTLWVSYYSSHEGKASIYLASVALRD
ncbi:MAG TPA: exo-alpha-sialidase [Treponema sp.]|nr:MAG: hypothetical protein A2001_18090 [Treponema sp. GWC1_61_84]OHE75964.1 MAG: hypothetical protein A2413_13555 [Treponema sp. RIFOXYC1_FULL_61_9]HCM25626.1 exo-alpha-sialidase [Treponema sp.]